MEPQKDAILPRYSIDTIERKSENTQALRDRLRLRKTRRPVVAYVGRLDERRACT